MTITVQFFGHYSDYFHDEPLQIMLPEGATIHDLTLTLAAQDARLAGITSHCRFAVEAEYAQLDQPLQDGNTVAVLPPMSGG